MRTFQDRLNYLNTVVDLSREQQVVCAYLFAKIDMS